VFLSSLNNSPTHLAKGSSTFEHTRIPCASFVVAARDVCPPANRGRGGQDEGTLQSEGRSRPLLIN
jgi:hypothetical protein